MKNTKKLLVCLLALVMVMAFVACSKECAHADADKDHKCDTCGEVLTECADADKDHKCDTCGKVLTECADTDKDHKCDTCGEVLTECADTDKDHKCDTCGEVLTECADADKDHKCDTCGEVLTECADADKDHKCDTCGEVLTECADADKNHKCDTCGKVVSFFLNGTDSVIDVNTGAPQETIINVNVDLLDKSATLDIIMPVAGVGNMYLVASEAGTDPTTSWLYMMATLIGKGTVSEADGNIQVDFAWNVESMNEETGEMISTPMSMSITVKENDGVYSATVNYLEYIIIDVDSNVKMTGSAEVIDVNTGAPQLTIVNLNLNMFANTATLDIIMPVEGVGNMYLVASEVGTDPATSWLYMMATIIGEGTVTEAEGGYKVNFAWNVESMNEETGEMISTPMALEVAVTASNGTYTATVNYLDYIVIDVAA